MNRRFYFIFCAILITGLCLVKQQAFAQDPPKQDPPKVIQFSGVILDEDTTTYLPGVNIYVPARGKMTNSDSFGFFTLPVVSGDSIVFNMVGYQRQYLKIPKMDSDSYTVVIEMKQDTIQLDNVNVRLFPTERDFKEAILAMRTPTELSDNLFTESIDPEVYEQYVQNATMSPQMNYRYFLDQQRQMAQDRVGPRSFSFLNPFAWAEFIKSLKKKD
ncbi:carboxypeptidase-like regulatory domain-containing protein [Fulvivirgaceae bacterium LMO-SS25]